MGAYLHGRGREENKLAWKCRGADFARKGLGWGANSRGKGRDGGRGAKWRLGHGTQVVFALN